MTEEEFRTGIKADGTRVGAVNIEVDLLATIHGRGFIHLAQHFGKMKDTAAAYIADHDTPGHRRDSDFIGNMLEALDGPEQRAIEAELTNPFDYVAEAELTLSRQFHGELVSKQAFFFALNNAIDALQRLDVIKKAWFYGRGEVGTKTDMPHTLTDTMPDHVGMYSGLTNEQAADYVHGVIGLATESGELLEGLRDVMRGKYLDVVNVKEEVGDAKWYMAILSRVCGFEWGEDERVNIAKLRARFPDKFTEYDANNRNLSAERVILEDEAKPIGELVKPIVASMTVADSDGDDGA